MPARKTAEGIVIAVRLTPKSGVDAILGIEPTADGGLVLKVRVTAAPEKGKANACLIALLAKWLAVPKTECGMVSGDKSRLKQVLIRGDADALMERLASHIAKLQSGG
ncbi:MAG: DUF167 family protein [Rhodomicrobiaceae bacterium]